MPYLSPNLDLARCPHCNVDRPNLVTVVSQFTTTMHDGRVQRAWVSYKCTRCGGVVVAGGLFGRSGQSIEVTEIYPRPVQVDESLPAIAREYLSQAINSLRPPAL
jgi:DNA-directed RNA polymerase subunit RPC12/RpoP